MNCICHAAVSCQHTPSWHNPRACIPLAGVPPAVLAYLVLQVQNDLWASTGAMPSVAYMQVLNKLHGQRFKLEESLRKLQDSMNMLEKEHAWQDHVDELSLPMQQHQAVVQVSK